MPSLRAALLLAAVIAPATVFAAEKTIQWDEAEKHVGEEATVEGTIVGVHCSPLSCLLAFEPSFNRFTAVIQARNFEDIPPDDLERRWAGKRVRVHGKIEQRDGKPEITVEKPEQLGLTLGAKRREERQAEKREQSETGEVMDRLAEVASRMEELTERLATVQERMETLLADLEQRQQALAAAQAASQPLPPPPPSYGEPQARPGFEALRTIKRGMSRADVARLVGEPQTVDGTPHGWTTWYYGYGRSVSFDERGRVQAFVGFPSP